MKRQKCRLLTTSVGIVIIFLAANSSIGPAHGNRSELATLSLVRDPLADVGRTAPEFDALGFALNQKLHSVTADQLYFSEFDGDDSACIERDANDLQIFRREPTADVKDQAPFSRKSVYSARHWPVSPVVYMANGVPFECN
jgi:hypothetical protein